MKGMVFVMKKTVSILCVCALVAVLLCACGSEGSSGTSQQPAGSGSQTGKEEVTIEPDDLSIMMTESYKKGRQEFYDVTGVWMPAVEGFEAECEVTENGRSVCFDSHGNKQLYLDAKEALEAAFGAPSIADPESDDVELYGASWEVPVEGGTAWFEVIYDQHDPADPWVYMNYHVELNEG